jgi:hypothetical protein
LTASIATSVALNSQDEVAGHDQEEVQRRKREHLALAGTDPGQDLQDARACGAGLGHVHAQ